MELIANCVKTRGNESKNPRCLVNFGVLRLVSIWSQTIADRRSHIAESSAIVCDHMETHVCDRLRSCDRLQSCDHMETKTKIWFYQTSILRSWSQTIAEDRTMFYLLRSSAIVCNPAIIWKPKQKFGFIKRVDKGWITTVKDLESWRFER